MILTIMFGIFLGNAMSSKEEALKIAAFIGCSGAHKDESGDWMPCSSHEILNRISMDAEPTKKVAFDEFEISNRVKYKKPSKRKHRGKKYERLRERGIAGISTMPDGSLSSMPPGSEGALF